MSYIAKYCHNFPVTRYSIFRGYSLLFLVTVDWLDFSLRKIADLRVSGRFEFATCEFVILACIFVLRSYMSEDRFWT